MVSHRIQHARRVSECGPCVPLNDPRVQRSRHQKVPSLLMDSADNGANSFITAFPRDSSILPPSKRQGGGMTIDTYVETSGFARHRARRASGRTQSAVDSLRGTDVAPAAMSVKRTANAAPKPSQEPGTGESAPQPRGSAEAPLRPGNSEKARRRAIADPFRRRRLEKAGIPPASGSHARLRFVERLQRRLPAEDAAAAVRMRAPRSSAIKSATSGPVARLRPAGPRRRAARARRACRSGRASPSRPPTSRRDGLVIDLERHREGMPVLAAMREREARRIGEAVGRAVHHLGDHRQRAHRARADSRASAAIRRSRPARDRPRRRSLPCRRRREDIARRARRDAPA